MRGHVVEFDIQVHASFMSWPPCTYREETNFSTLYVQGGEDRRYSIKISRISYPACHFPQIYSRFVINHCSDAIVNTREREQESDRATEKQSESKRASAHAHAALNRSTWKEMWGAGVDILTVDTHSSLLWGLYPRPTRLPERWGVLWVIAIL